MLDSEKRIMLSTNRGFSLIELMITLVILAILLMIGVPTMQHYINNSKVRAVAAEISDGLQTARMEAIRANPSATFCLSAANGTGWDVRQGSDCTGTVLLSKTKAASEAAAVVLDPTALTVTFNSGGRSTTGASTLNVSLKNTCSGDCLRMQVQVSAGGMARTCNRDMAAGDPQACL